MRASYHKDFKKAYKKLSKSLKQKTNERIELFIKDPYNPLLNNHALTGKYLGYRSINITGDFRAIYKLLYNEIAFYVSIDTHSNLYK